MTGSPIAPALDAIQAAGAVTVELVCDHHTTADRGLRGRLVIRVEGCLGELDDAIVPEVLAAGAARVVLRLDECPSRPLVAVPGLDALVDVEDGAPRGWRVGRRVVVSARARRVSRRVLVNPLATAVVGADDSADPGDEPSSTVHRRLRTALRALAAQGRWSAPPTDGPGLRLKADGCRSAGTCVRACPEQALSLVKDGGERAELMFDPGACSGCRRCIEFCDADALTEGGPTRWSDLLADEVVRLAEPVTRTCRRCGDLFSPEDGEGFCPVCTFRRAHPFGTQRSCAGRSGSGR